MAKLTPLVFPEDESIAPPARSEFPYAPKTSSNQPPPNRMQQLEEMLKEAQGRAEIIEKEAYDKAYLAGEKAGMALGKTRGKQILQSLQETLQGTEQAIALIQQSFADAAMDVAQHIAREIVGDCIANNSETLLAIAKQAAAQLPDLSNLRIAVSPDDFSTFKRLLEDDESAMILVSEASVASGTCRIISSQQDILIDPVEAVHRCIEQLRTELQPSTTPHA